MSTTRSMFRSSALLSGLVTQDQFDQAIAAARKTALIPSEVTEVDDDVVAAKLIEMKLLTAYQAEQIKKLEKENLRLQKKLRQAEIIIDVQKKLSEVLGLEMPEIARDDR